MATLTIYPTSISGSDWTNPNNALTIDSTYASVSMSKNTLYTLTANFTNSLPSGATITAISAVCRSYKSSNSVSLSVETLNGTSISIASSASDETVSVGTTFPSSITLQVEKSTLLSLSVYVDCIWLEITYAPASSGTGVYLKQSGSWNEVNSVYKKINGAWVLQTDNSNLTG
jgi:hypothetical protein